MGRPGHLTDRVAATALTFLERLDRSQAGYERRGVRGWALRTDVERHTNSRLTDRLAELARRGVVDSDDASAPGAARAALLYRINQEGANRLATFDRGDPPYVVQAPGPRGPADAAVYIPERSFAALLALREVRESPSSKLKGEFGWITHRELRDRRLGEGPDWLDERILYVPEDRAWRGPGDAAAPPVGFGADDLAWLLRAGFAQRWAYKVTQRGRAEVLWRVTPAGVGALPLTWPALSGP